MGWNAGEDLVVGSVVTSTKWNSYMGTAGSLEYLKAVDATVSVAQPARALNTVYQNTSGKIRLISISAKLEVGVSDNNVQGNSSIDCLCDTSTAPTTRVAFAETYAWFDGLLSGGYSRITHNLSFISPPKLFLIEYF